MDKREILLKLENKYSELKREMDSLRGEVIDFEETPEYQEYLSYSSDVVKETMYPKEYEVYKKIEGLQVKVDAFNDEIMRVATEINKEITEKINALENKLNVNKEHLEKLQSKIKKQENQLKKLKATEEYINGDEAALLKVEELEAQLEANRNTHKKWSEQIATIEKDLEIVKEEKQKLIDEYGIEIEPVVEPVVEEAPTEPEKVETETEPVVESAPAETEKVEVKTEPVVESAPTHSEKVETKTEPVVESVPKEPEKVEGKTEPEKVGSRRRVRTAQRPVVSNVIDTTLVEEPKADEDTEKDPKEQFKELYKRAKEQTLTEDDFYRLADIMRFSENYDTFGITTGFIFNKSRVIFRAMGKVAGIYDLKGRNAQSELDSRLQEAYAIVKQDPNTLTTEGKIKWNRAQRQIKQCNLLKEAMETRSIVTANRDKARWGWLMEEAQPALPEESVVDADFEEITEPKVSEPSKSDISKDLEGKTNEVFDEKAVEALPITSVEELGKEENTK